MSTIAIQHNSADNHIKEEDIRTILARYNSSNEDMIMLNYSVHHASDKMLGFLAEYWKIKVHLSTKKVLYFFVKSISRSNAAQANMVKELRLFDKEVFFYSEIKEKIEVPGLRRWAAKLITALDDAIVFEDLNAMNFKLRNKFDRFDMAHTFEALKTLARFHASSIIFEEKKSKETRCQYVINDEYKESLDKGGYHLSSDWFLQCMAGALEAIKSFSKYDDSKLNLIESSWSDVWSNALSLSDFSPKYRNVICHRDLWNNNIMFHYDIEQKPDDCVLVDFQAIRCQPPAGDVMLLLCCNLDPTFREQNMEIFLIFYYAEVEKILSNHGIQIEDIMTKKEFNTSAEEQRQWGLIACACLMPHFWLDDDLTKNIFSDNTKFNDIFSKRKGKFIKEMMERNSEYKEKVMEIFEEIVDRYCVNAKDN